MFIQFTFYYSVQIRLLQKPNCAFTKSSVTHALKQLRTACFRAVTILIWYPVGMCDCATVCCLTERGRVVLSFISATGFCGCISVTACCMQLCQRVGVLCKVVFPRQRVKRSCISGAACCSKLHVLRQRGGELCEFTLLLRRVLQSQREGVLLKIAIARGRVL